MYCLVGMQKNRRRSHIAGTQVLAYQPTDKWARARKV